MITSFEVGDWCWMPRQASACRIVDRMDAWGQVTYRVWLPGKEVVIRARSEDLDSLQAIRPSADHVLHAVAAAKLQDALEDNLLLAPIQSIVVQIGRASCRERVL